MFLKMLACVKHRSRLLFRPRQIGFGIFSLLALGMMFLTLSVYNKDSTVLSLHKKGLISGDPGASDTHAMIDVNYIQAKKKNPKDDLMSTIYASNKTNFEDSFPSGAKIASTLNTKFVIGNFNICKGIDHIAYMTVVHSAVKHQDRRQTIRSTWGRQNLIQGLPSKTIFLVGQIEDNKAQEALTKENDIYGDIIQGQFVDNHRNLTLKNIMGLQWLSTYCSRAKFIVKVDDDVFVDIFAVAEMYFKDLESSPKRIICEVGTRNFVFRTKDFPPEFASAVSDDYFKGLTFYPMPWCFGFAVFMSMDLAKELYQAAKVVPSYPLDDVYVYGILPSTIKGVTWRNEEDRLSKEEDETLSNWGCAQEKPLIAGTFRIANTAQKLWNTLLNCLHNSYALQAA